MAAPAPPRLADPAVDPSVKTAIEWSTRRAALASRGVPEDDPRMTEATAALAYHRVSRAIGGESGSLDPAHVAQLCEQLRAAAGAQR